MFAALTAIGVITSSDCGAGSYLSQTKATIIGLGSAQVQPKVDYQEYLLKIGEKLNCYYTIERLADTKEKDSPLSLTEIVDDDVATIDALVTKLNRELPGVTAARDETNRSVIRLTEDALLKVDGYDLGRKITWKYQGDPYHMLVELNKLVPTVGRPKMFAFPGIGLDVTTPVKVDVQDQPIRQVLTFALPLEGYNRILWVARMSNLQNQLYTDISYFGLKQLEPPDPDEPQ
jgi:hypothetical protein